MKMLMLKEQYKKLSAPRGIYGFLRGYSYLCRRNDIYREFSTLQEKSCAEMHEIEYAEYGLKIRVRRAAGLPDSREDLYSGLHGVEKCWKNNSKRRYQWIGE